MHIAELAREAAVNVQTIRFYEREKLLAPPLRNRSGYRCYGPPDLDRVKFIRRNQELGFTLAEVKQLMELHDILAAMPKPLKRKPAQVREIVAIGRERLVVVKEKIRTLNSMKRQLEFLVRHLEAAQPVTCPVAATTVKPAAVWRT